MEAMRTEVTRARRSAKETARQLREEGKGFNREDLWGDGSGGAGGEYKMPKWKEFHQQLLEDESFTADVKANQKGVLAGSPRGDLQKLHRTSAANQVKDAQQRIAEGGRGGSLDAAGSFDDARISEEATARIVEWRKEFVSCDIDNSGYLDNDELVEVPLPPHRSTPLTPTPTAL